MTDIATDGPFKIEAKVLLIGISGEYKGYEAWASVDLPPGKVPSDAEFTKLMANSQKEIGDNFRLATRHEFVSALLAERTGGVKVSVPGLDVFRLETAQ